MTASVNSLGTHVDCQAFVMSHEARQSHATNTTSKNCRQGQGSLDDQVKMTTGEPGSKKT